MKKIDSGDQTPESGEIKQKQIQQTTGPIILMTLITSSDKKSDAIGSKDCIRVKMPGNMIAWSFLKVNIDEEDSAKYFYLRTKGGDIYKVFRKESNHLYDLTRDQKIWDNVIKNCPTERLLFNPKTGNLVGIENPIITYGKPFVCAKNLTTPTVLEIIGCTGSGGTVDGIEISSTIEQEYKQQKKK